MSEDELTSTLLYQIGAVKTMTETLGGKLHHVKPHGALYNAAASDYKLGQLIAGLLKSIDPNLILYGLPNSEMERAAHHEGVAFFAEVFADRAYNNDGSLLNRNMPGAVLLDPDEMIQRIVKLLDENVVVSATGERIPVKADTICIHSDNPVAASFVKKLFGIFSKE